MFVLAPNVPKFSNVRIEIEMEKSGTEKMSG